MAKYPPLPVMQCDPNCGECCGVVPCTQGEFVAVEAYAMENGLTPVAQGLTCPWYQNGGCAVHPVRPAVCRLFGHVPQLECPRGYNVNVGGTLKRKWDEKVQGATKFLHQALDGWSVEELPINLKSIVMKRK